METSQRFRAPYRGADFASIMLQVVCLLTLIGGMIYTGKIRPDGGLLLVVVIGWCLYQVVLGYRLEGTMLHVRRVGRNLRFDLSKASSIALRPQAAAQSKRIEGIGGKVLKLGWFWNDTLGAHQAFVMDHGRTVVIEWPKRILAISPDDPEGFLRAARAVAPASQMEMAFESKPAST